MSNSTLTTGTWTLDSAHTDVDFVVRHAGISKVRGTFGDVSGELVLTDDFTASSVEATIGVASIDSGNEQRDGHLRSADFFDVEQFPQMTFRSAGVTGTEESFTLSGVLVSDAVKLEISAAFVLPQES